MNLPSASGRRKILYNMKKYNILRKLLLLKMTLVCPIIAHNPTSHAHPLLHWRPSKPSFCDRVHPISVERKKKKLSNPATLKNQQNRNSPTTTVEVMYNTIQSYNIVKIKSYYPWKLLDTPTPMVVKLMRWVSRVDEIAESNSGFVAQKAITKFSSQKHCYFTAE